MVLAHGQGRCGFSERTVFEVTQVHRRSLPRIELAQRVNQGRIIGPALHLVERVRRRRRPEAEQRPALAMPGLVAGEVQDGPIEPAFEFASLLGGVLRWPAIRKGLLHDLFRLLPVMHERHGETEGVVLQLHYEGFEPWPIVRFQSVLPFRNPTAQRPSGPGVTTNSEEGALLQLQVAFDQRRAELASLDVEPQDTALPKLLEAGSAGGEELFGGGPFGGARGQLR